MRLIPRPGRTADTGAEAPDGEDDGEDDREDEADPPRSALATLALRTAASALAVVAAAAVVADRGRLGARAAWALALIALGVAVVWKRGARRPPGAWAAWPLATATAVLATALGRGPGDEGPTFAARVLDLDIAPLAAFLAVSCLVPVVAACVALSVVAWDEPVGHRRRARSAVRAGLCAAVAVAGLAVAVSAVARAQVDARAEAANVDHDARGTAERAGTARGPDRPTAEPAWRTPSTPGEDRAPLAVPGWDVLLAVDELGTTLTAVSTDDGATVWRYHRDGAVRSVRVDPEAGRVLLLGGEAAVVLDLADGSQVASRRVPGSAGACPGVPPAVDVAPAALLACDGGLVAVEAATGLAQVPAELPQDSPGAVGHCELASPAGDPATVVRSGDGRCARPEVLVHDEEADRVEVLASVGPVGAGGEDVALSESRVQGILRAGDLIVLDVRWADGSADGEIVAVDRDGDVRWQAPATGGRLVAATGDAVVTADHRYWRLVALDDGAELARSPMGGFEHPEEPFETTDGERLYSLSTADDDGDPAVDAEAPDLVVRSLDDLSIVGTWEGIAPAGTWGLAAAGARVVFAADGELVAHGPGTDPPASTDPPPPYEAAQDGGEVRLVDSGFTVVPDPATSEDTQPIEHVSVGAVLETASAQVAADTRVRLQPVDAAGRPVPVVGARDGWVEQVGTVVPGRQALVGSLFAVEAGHGVADVVVEVDGASMWWPADHPDLDVAPIDATGARVTWAPPGEREVPDVLTVTVDSARDEPVELTADVILRATAGGIVGGWSGAARRSGQPVVAPPGRSTAEMEVGVPRAWLAPGAAEAQVEVGLGTLP